MNFRSTTDVVVNNLNELFHAMTIYVPKRFALANVVDWDDSFVTAERPAVFTAVVDNYLTIMQGDLLAQWQPIFRQDTNSAVVLYVVVFDDSQPCEVESRDIKHASLEKAFNALFSFSYFKFMFDPTYDGAPVSVPASPGTAPRIEVTLLNNSGEGIEAKQTVLFLNTTGSAVTIPGGSTYKYNSSISNPWAFSVDDDVVLAAAGAHYGSILPSDPNNFEADPAMVIGRDVTTFFQPEIASGVKVVVVTVQQGNGTSQQTEVDLVFTNVSKDAVVIEATTYTVNDGQAGSIEYEIEIDAAVDLDAGGTYTQRITALNTGYDANLVEGGDITSQFLPDGDLPPAGVKVFSTDIVQGQSASAGQDITIPAGTYTYNSGITTYPLIVPTDSILPSGAVSASVIVQGVDVGVDANVVVGEVDGERITPAFPEGIVLQISSIMQGTAATPAPTTIPSTYFDLSLALASLVKSNISLSWMWSLVRVNFVDRKPSAQDACWIIYQDRATQLSNMTSLTEASRARYYWAALYLMRCENTTVIVHSEPENIIVDILSAWFAQRNSSGTYIGNKLSLLRLSGTRIKPLGWPSWLDNSINENAAIVHEQLRDMNVGHLATISDNTPQESYLTMARGVGDVDKGIPTSMQMIAKFVDYTCAMAAANLVTNTGTLTSALMTDEKTYGIIQSIVFSALSRFSGTVCRLYDIQLRFPSFIEAKKSRTALSAASAWKTKYADPLDSVDVSGGIVAE